MSTNRRRADRDTAPIATIERDDDASLDVTPFDAVDGFASAECEIEFDDGLIALDALDVTDIAPPDHDDDVLDRVLDFADDGDVDATMDYARGAAVEPAPAADALDPYDPEGDDAYDPDGPAGQTADFGLGVEVLAAYDAPYSAAPIAAPLGGDDDTPAARPAPAAAAVDYDALDAPVDGPSGTADFGSAPHLLDDLVEDAEPAPEPEGPQGPPAIATAWTERLTAAVDDLVIAHARNETWRGQFSIGERGLTGQPSPARGEPELDADLARLHALLVAAADVIRQDATRAPAAIVVADALARLDPPTDARALARALRRSLYARTRKRRARLDAEADAVEARRRALQSQRRLRADLAARLARLDASITAQEAAVRRDGERARNLDAERADLDGVFERVDVPSDPPAPVSERLRRAETSDPGDAVRRLLAVGALIS